jgi:hypothetical protein
VTNNATSITIQQSTDGGLTWTTVATLGTTATFFAAIGLGSSTSYEYQVITNNNTGGFSPDPTDPGLPVSLTAPTGLTGTIDNSGNMNLTWQAGTGAATINYIIDRETVATGVWQDGFATAATTSYQDKLPGGYAYRVSATTGTSGTTATSNVFPQARYAVIDLTPLTAAESSPYCKITPQGKVLISLGTAYNPACLSPDYGPFNPMGWTWANGVLSPPYIIGMNSFGNNLETLWGGLTDLNDSGTILATVVFWYDPPDFGDGDPGYVNSHLVTWSSLGTSGPSLVPFPPSVDGFPNAVGVALDGAGNIWSIQNTTTDDVQDGFNGNTELGDVALESNGNVTGTEIEPLAVNTSGDYISCNGTNYYNENDTYYLNVGMQSLLLPDLPFYIYQPYGISERDANGIIRATGGSTWCSLSTSGVGTTNSVAGCYYFIGINAATAISGGATNSAFQAIGKDNENAASVWTMNPATNVLGPPEILDSLVPAAGGWSGFQPTSINDSCAIVGIAQKSLNPDGTPATPLYPANYFYPGSWVVYPSHAVMLLPAELGVDANRDGTIVLANDANNPANAGLPVDTTSATQPFRFWVNDGQNTAEDTAALYGDQVTTANESPGTINFKGDLENFTRLWIYTGGLQSAIQSGAIKVALQWQNVTSGSPAINVYKAYESNGDTGYLNDDTTAGNQIAGTYGTAVAKVTGTSAVVLPTSLFSNLSSTNPKTYCLFEGAGVGVGELGMVFENSSGTVIGQGGQVYMNLKTVTDMFKQAQVTPSGVTDIANAYSFPGTGNWSSTTSANDANGPPSYAAGTSPTVGWNDTTSSNFEHPADETKDCILFVHGWNVTNQRYAQQSIECFKRLWLQGYKGLYAAIRWPGDVTGSDTGGAAVTAANATDYFEIEYRAFKYGGSVKQYTASLAGQGYTVGVMSHSMGGIVSSEALKEGANFEYVLMDAAVSSRCYDTSTGLEFTGTTFNPPDLYTSGGYGGYFSGLSGLINFYNGSDNALIHSWQAANEVTKGETDISETSYVFTGGVGVQLQYILSPTHPQYFYRDVFANGVTNYHESMAMYAVTRTPALGSESAAGAISEDVNMQDYFPGSSAHSPQFDLDVQDSSGGAMLFYQQVLTEFNFQ